MEDARDERAFTIGCRIAALDHRAGLEGGDVTEEMTELMNALVAAPSASVEDAHALSVVAWLILIDTLRKLPTGSPEEVRLRHAVQVAAVFCGRSIDTMENVTGMPLGAFFGEKSFRQ